MSLDIARDRGEAVIVAFEGLVTSSDGSFDAAAARVVEVLNSGSKPIVVCAEPIAMANVLAHCGLRTVTIPTENSDDGLIADLAASEVTPVLEGGADRAIELANRLPRADVIIYTTGRVVMSADPDRVAGARRIERANHLEMLELNTAAQSLVPARTAWGAHRHGVAYELRDVINNEGTLVRHDNFEDRTHPITSISVSKGFAFFSVRPHEGDLAHWLEKRTKCLERLAANDISVEMLQFARSRLRFVVADSVIDATRSTISECILSWRLVQRCAKICVVGAGIRTTAGIFYRTLTGLAQRNVPVLTFSDSNVTMSLVIPETHAADAESFLHDALAVGSGSSFTSPITFDASLGRVRVNGEERRLGARQAKLLQFLIENVGRVIEGEEAARHLFGNDSKESVSALRVHMHNLRKKIEVDPDNPRYIVTVHAQGYLFVR